MHQVSKFRVPEIFITLASPKYMEDELESPFASWLSPLADEDDDTKFRRNHLTPPPRPVDSPRVASRTSSPTRGESPIVGSGLERQQFEKMLQKSLGNIGSGNAKRTTDLRKEIALRAHQQARHLQRRALFLAKLNAPPSPSAVMMPKTPPESPGIFHFTLPSPGLTSPLAMFDGAESPIRQAWVEEVDFRNLNSKKETTRRPLPSLEQITARLNSVGHPVIISPATASANGAVDRLPAFLRPRTAERKPLPTPPVSAAKTEQVAPAPVRRPLPPSPSKCDIDTVKSRTNTARNMVETLGKRTHDRRKSSPAELQNFARNGFTHEVLASPGAF